MTFNQAIRNVKKAFDAWDKLDTIIMRQKIAGHGSEIVEINREIAERNKAMRKHRDEVVSSLKVEPRLRRG